MADVRIHLSYQAEYDQDRSHQTGYDQDWSHQTGYDQDGSLSKIIFTCTRRISRLRRLGTMWLM